MRRLLAVTYITAAIAFAMFAAIMWRSNTPVEYYLAQPCAAAWMLAGLFGAAALVAAGRSRKTPGAAAFVAIICSAFGATIASMCTLEILRLNENWVYGTMTAVPVLTFFAPWIYWQCRANGRTYRTVDVLLTTIASCIFVVIVESFRERMHGNFYGRLTYPSIVLFAAPVAILLSMIVVWIVPPKWRFLGLATIFIAIALYELFFYAPGYVAC